MSRLNNENILKEIFSTYTLSTNKQQFQKLRSKILTIKVFFKHLTYENIFKSIHKQTSLNTQKAKSVNFSDILPNGGIIVGLTEQLDIYSPKNFKLIKKNPDIYIRALLVLEDNRIFACFDEKIEIWGELVKTGFEVLDTIIRSYEYKLFHTPVLLSNGNLACCANGVEDEGYYLLILENKNNELVKVIREQDGINAIVNISDNMFATAGENYHNIRI
jgi:hypothetical protein